MTTTTSPHHVDPATRRLERGDGPIGGVAAGLADYFNIDPTVVRLGIVAATLISGPVIPVCYVASWMIIPSSESVPPPPVASPATAPPAQPAPPSEAPTSTSASAPAAPTDTTGAHDQETDTDS